MKPPQQTHSIKDRQLAQFIAALPQTKRTEIQHLITDLDLVPVGSKKHKLHYHN